MCTGRWRPTADDTASTPPPSLAAPPSSSARSADRRYLTRRELGDKLRQSGLALDNVPLALLSIYAELEGVICSGPRRDKQFTYALMAERAPDATRLSRDEALATLSRRYFRSHGPATIRDFVWWSGLMTADARRGSRSFGPGSRRWMGGRTGV
jgi:hypothetical protein